MMSLYQATDAIAQKPMFVSYSAGSFTGRTGILRKERKKEEVCPNFQLIALSSYS